MGERAWVVDRVSSTVVRCFPQHSPVEVDCVVVQPILRDDDAHSLWEYAVAYAIGMDWASRPALAEALMRPLACLMARHRTLQSMIFTDMDCSSLVMMELVRRHSELNRKESGT